MTRKISQLGLNIAPKGTDIIEVSEDLGGGSFGSKKITLDQLGTQLGYIHLRDQQPSNGGTATSGSWELRILNTETIDTGNDCSLVSSQFTLTAGTYEIEASAPAYNCNQHQVRLWNVTDAAQVMVGDNAVAVSSSTISKLEGRFTITVPKTFELQHQVATTRVTDGHGVGVPWGGNVFAMVTLRKVGGQHPTLLPLGYIHLQDQKGVDVDGGSSIAGTQIRDLNTEVTDTGNDCTLAANQFTLTAGTYEIDASAPSFAASGSKLFLYNVTDAGNELIGPLSGAQVGEANNISCPLRGRFTIATAKTFEIRQYTQAAGGGSGLGFGSIGSGQISIFTDVVLIKVVT